MPPKGTRYLLFGLAALACQVAFGGDAGRNLAVEEVPAADARRRVALVIGNASYPGVAVLRNSVHDASDIAAKLRRLGFDVTLKTNVGLKDMLRTLTTFEDKIPPRADVLVFYAGHGMQVRGKNYLIPIDAEIRSENAVSSEAVDVDQLLDKLSRARLSMVILDACRNNPFERRFRGSGQGLASINAPAGTLIAYATAPGKVASDGDGRNGLYTQELLAAMDIPGIKIEDVFKRVRAHVIQKSGEAQTPWESSSLTGDFFFSGNAAGTLSSPPAPAYAAIEPIREPLRIETTKPLKALQLTVGEQLDGISIYPMRICDYARPVSAILDESIRRLAPSKAPGIEFIGDSTDAVLNIQPIKAVLAKAAGADSDYINTMRVVLEGKLLIGERVVMTKTYESRSTSKYASCCSCSAWDGEIDKELKKVIDDTVGRLLGDLANLHDR